MEQVGSPTVNDRFQPGKLPQELGSDGGASRTAEEAAWPVAAAAQGGAAVFTTQPTARLWAGGEAAQSQPPQAPGQGEDIARRFRLRAVEVPAGKRGACTDSGRARTGRVV